MEKYIRKKNNSIQYVVSSVKELQVIKKHFENFPLHTQKRADFELWKQALDIVQNKEHLTVQGLEKIFAIKSSLNKGMTDVLNAAFPKIVPIKKSLVENEKIFDPSWMAGFFSAEGCFLILKHKSSTKLGVSFKLVFQITQHKRDETLIKSFIKYFGCGFFIEHGNYCEYRVGKFSDIHSKIIPFLSKNQVQGIKFLDYLDLCKAAEIFKANNHLTKDGQYQLDQIKARMNKNRSLNC